MNHLAPRGAGDAAPDAPTGRLSWPRRLVKGLRFVARRAGEENLLQVASSLTFTTVLAIVPMLAVVLALFTAFPLFQDFRLALEDFLTTSLMPPAVSDNIMDYLSQFARQASRLTAIGGAFLLITSVLLIMTIDKAFNDIWHVTRQRPLTQRALIYWATVTLGPVVAGASLWTTSFLARESLGLLRDVPGVLRLTFSLIPLLLVGAGFAALFVIVPNRRVYWRDALAGGFGTAILLELMKSAFAYYVTGFPAYTVIYGAFATLPLFLLWIYLSWLAVLFGATVAASLPLMRLGRWDIHREPGAELIDAVALLQCLYQAMGNTPPGRSAARLARTLRLHQDELHGVLERLAGIGLVARTDTGRWTLACNPGTMSLAPVYDAFALDRHQPRLQAYPEVLALVRAVASGGPVPTLEELAERAHNNQAEGVPAGSDATKNSTASADILKIDARKQ